MLTFEEALIQYNSIYKVNHPPIWTRDFIGPEKLELNEIKPIKSSETHVIIRDVGHL